MAFIPDQIRAIFDGVFLVQKKFNKQVYSVLHAFIDFVNGLRLNSSELLPDGTIDINGQTLDNVGAITIESEDSTGKVNYYNGGGFPFTNYGSFTLYKSRGTVASPSVPSSADGLGSYRFGGYTGSSPTYEISGQILARATENFSATAAGTELTFWYTPNTTKTLTLGAILGQNGNLTIGTVAGTGSKSLYLLDGNFAGAVYHVASVAGKPSGNIPAGTAPSSPVAGDYWHDSTQKSIKSYLAEITQSLSATLFTGTANANVVNTVTETTLIGSGIGSLALPANFFVIGKTIRFTLKGGIETSGTPTLRIRIKLGSTTILDTTATTLAAITGTQLFEINGELTCRTTGASGTIMGEGRFNYFMTATTMTPVSMYLGTAVTVDTTAAQTLDITAEWGTAAAANAIRHRISVFEVLN